MAKKIDVLLKAREILREKNDRSGLCVCISEACWNLTGHMLMPYGFKKHFPQFTRRTAYEQGFRPLKAKIPGEKEFTYNTNLGFWWSVPNANRGLFLDWLIEQYKDDEEDLLEMKLFNKNKQ